MKKTTTKKETVATDELLEDVVETESAEESIVEKVTSKKAEKKKYALTDGIPCRSITQGGLYMHGIKSDIAYKWSNDGDVTEVEYQDLVAAVRSSVSYVMKPYFIIEDKEFVLPEGAKESIKHMASAMISNGSLDSVKKIKILDEIFDTKFMLMTEMFS